MTVDADQGTGALFTFTNTYNVPEESSSPTDGSLTLNKVLTGRDMAAGEFGFVMTGTSENAQGLSATGTNTAAVDGEAGSVTLSAITFQEPGTYECTISEVAGDAEGITYDDTTYTAKVVVTDDGQGSFKVSQLTYNDGVEFPLFTNTYTEPSAGGESDEGPIEYLTKTSDTWLPYFLGIIAAAAAAVVGISLRKIQSAHAAPRGRHGR